MPLVTTAPNYRSQLERNVGAQLNRLGVPFEFEPWSILYWRIQRGVVLFNVYGETCDYHCTPYKEHWYTPDFVMGDLVVETKGRLIAKERTKLLAIRDSHPGMDLRVVV